MCHYLIRKFEIDQKYIQSDQKWSNVIEFDEKVEINWIFQYFNQIFQSFLCGAPKWSFFKSNYTDIYIY